MNFKPLVELVDLFVAKEWTKQENYKIVLENFCNLLTNLDEEKRELIMQLTQKYSWISSNEYNSRLTRLLDKIEDSKLANCKRIIVFPIMKPEHEDKIKSGHPILYMVRAVKPFLTKYSRIEIKEFIKYVEISEENFKPKKTDLIFLMDDFLGSGETIEASIKKVLENKNIEVDMINVLAIACQQATIDFANDNSIALYYEHLEKRGITDNFSPDVIQEKLDLMLEIEQMIPGGSMFSLGFNNSEALITLMRTPDNTFPIFWKQYTANGKKFTPPFPRD